MADLELLELYKKFEIYTILENEYNKMIEDCFIDNKNKYYIVCSCDTRLSKTGTFFGMEFYKAFSKLNDHITPKSSKITYVYSRYKANVIVIGEDNRLVANYIATVYFHDDRKSYIVINNDGKIIISTNKFGLYYVGSITDEVTDIKITRYNYVKKLLTKHNKYFENVNIEKPIPESTISYILERYYAKYLKGEIHIEAPIQEYTNTYQTMLYDSGCIVDDETEELLEMISNDTRDYNYCSIISSFINIKVDTYKTIDNVSKYWNMCNVIIPLTTSCTKEDIIKYQNEIMSMVYWYLHRKVREIKQTPEVLKFIKPVDIILTADKMLLVKFGYKGDNKMGTI